MVAHWCAGLYVVPLRWWVQLHCNCQYPPLLPHQPSSGARGQDCPTEEEWHRAVERTLGSLAASASAWEAPEGGDGGRVGWDAVGRQVSGEEGQGRDGRPAPETGDAYEQFLTSSLGSVNGASGGPGDSVGSAGTGQGDISPWARGEGGKGALYPEMGRRGGDAEGNLNGWGVPGEDMAQGSLNGIAREGNSYGTVREGENKGTGEEWSSNGTEREGASNGTGRGHSANGNGWAWAREEESSGLPLGEGERGFSGGEGEEAEEEAAQGYWDSIGGFPGVSVPIGDAGWEPWHLLPSMMDDMPLSKVSWPKRGAQSFSTRAMLLV